MNLKLKLPRQVGDPYERNARLYPALVLIAPVVLAASAIFSPKLSLVGHGLVGLAGCVAAFLLAQLARDKGRNAEPGLWKGWGGCPSVAILRHRDTRIDAITKARYHQSLYTLVPGTTAPNADAEAADPAEADQVYEAWGNYIRGATRDTKKFDLLFKENVSYGFRRNLWGLKNFGITVAAISTVVLIARVAFLLYASREIGDELPAALVLTVCLLVMWIFVINAHWVYTPADAYARRFSECVDILKPPTAQAAEPKKAPAKNKKGGNGEP